MILTVDKTTKEQDLYEWLNAVRDKRKTIHKFQIQTRMSKYYGILPNIGDGLQIQKELRNEWE